MIPKSGDFVKRARPCCIRRGPITETYTEGESVLAAGRKGESAITADVERGGNGLVHILGLLRGVQHICFTTGASTPLNRSERRLATAVRELVKASNNPAATLRACVQACARGGTTVPSVARGRTRARSSHLKYPTVGAGRHALACCSGLF